MRSLLPDNAEKYWLAAGLVAEMRQGRENRYRLVPESLAPIRDWIAHYGRAFPRFSNLKRRYDPQGILTPGPGIF